MTFDMTMTGVDIKGVHADSIHVVSNVDSLGELIGFITKSSEEYMDDECCCGCGCCDCESESCDDDQAHPLHFVDYDCINWDYLVDFVTSCTTMLNSRNIMFTDSNKNEVNPATAIGNLVDNIDNALGWLIKEYGNTNGVDMDTAIAIITDCGVVTGFFMI